VRRRKKSIGSALARRRRLAPAATRRTQTPLRRLIKGRAGLLFAEQIQGKSVELYEAICARDLEGIVAKHRLGPYEARPVTRFKLLNPAYTQKRGRREMFDKFRHESLDAPAR
jgi:hypothetical protein